MKSDFWVEIAIAVLLAALRHEAVVAYHRKALVKVYRRLGDVLTASYADRSERHPSKTSDESPL